MCGGDRNGRVKLVGSDTGYLDMHVGLHCLCTADGNIRLDSQIAGNKSLIGTLTHIADSWFIQKTNTKHEKVSMNETTLCSRVLLS